MEKKEVKVPSAFADLSIFSDVEFKKLARVWKHNDEISFSEKMLIECTDGKFLYIAHCGPRENGKFVSTYCDVEEFSDFTKANVFFEEQSI